jgi:hypothetical protein
MANATATASGFGLNMGCVLLDYCLTAKRLSVTFVTDPIALYLAKILDAAPAAPQLPKGSMLCY